MTSTWFTGVLEPCGYACIRNVEDPRVLSTKIFDLKINPSFHQRFYSHENHAFFNE